MSLQLLRFPSITAADLYEAVGLNGLCYPEGFRGEFKVCLGWFIKNPSMFHMVKDEGKLIACATAMPVSAECYEWIKGGDFDEMAINGEMIEKDGRFVYLASMAVHPEYRKTNALLMMIKSVKKWLKDARTEKVIANAISDGGRRICKIFGMKRLKKSKDGGWLYESAPYRV